MAATFELFHRTHRTRHATHSRISGKNGLRIHRYAVMVTFLKFLKETQVITPSCLGHQPRVQCTHRVPFEFVIPNSLISARSDVALDYLNLLPTVQEGPAFRGVNSQRLYMRPMMEYMLTASAMHIDSGRRYQCKQDISVMPSNAVAPPLQVEDFPGDYTLTYSQGVETAHMEPANWKVNSVSRGAPTSEYVNQCTPSINHGVDKAFFRAMRSPRVCYPAL